MRNKVKKIGALFTALLVICLAGAACNKTAEPEKPSDSGKENPGAEQITTDQTASDKDTLRKLLAADGKFAITIAEDIYVDEPIQVNGTKTLIGTKSIIMELNVEQYQHLLIVQKGASLVLDGATIDGNGAASCVKVEKEAELICKSGEIVWGCPYGIETYGDVTITDGSIRETMNTALYVRDGGKAYMTGGAIVDSSYCAARISSAGYMSISDDAVLANSLNWLVYNMGTCDITGGSLHDAKEIIAYNFGDMNITYSGTDPEGRLEWYNAGGHGISQGKKGTLNVKGLSLNNIGWHGISTAEGDCEVNLENCVIKNVVQAGLYLRGASVELKDLEMVKCGTAGVYVGSGTEVGIKDLSIIEPGGRGIWNFGGTVTASNVVIKSAGEFGVTSTEWEGVKGSVTIDNLLVDGTEKDSALNANGSTINVTDSKILNAGIHGAFAKNKGSINLKNVEIVNAKQYAVVEDGVGCNISLDHVKVTGGLRGVVNYHGTVTGKNVVVNSVEQFAVTSSYKESVVTLDGLEINDCKGYAAVNAGSSTTTIKNAVINRPTERGLAADDGATLTVEHVTIQEPGNVGILNIGATVKGSDVTINKTGIHGIYSEEANGMEGLVDITNLKMNGTAKNGLHSTKSVIKVTGGEIHEAGNIAAYAVDGGKVWLKDVDIADSKGFNITVDGQQSTVGNSYINLENVTIEGGQRGIVSYKGTVEGKDVVINSTEQFAVTSSYKESVIALDGLEINDCRGYAAVNAGSSTTTIKNAVINRPEERGLAADSGATLTLDHVTIQEPGNVGILNIGATVKGSNVTINETGIHGIYSEEANGMEGLVDITDLKMNGTEKNGLHSTKSVIKVTGGEIHEAGNIAAYAVDGGKVWLKDVNIADTKGFNVTADGQQSVIGNSYINLENVNITGGQRGIVGYKGTVEGKGVVINSTEQFAVTSSFAESVITLDGLEINDCKGYAAVNAGASTTTIKNAVISRPVERGLAADAGATLTVEHVTIQEPGNVGILNLGATVKGTDVTINATGIHGIYSEEANGTEGLVDIADLKMNGTAGNGLHSTKSVIKVTGGEIQNAGNIAAYAVDGGKVWLKDVSIADTKGFNVTADGQKSTVGNSYINLENVNIAGGQRGVVSYKGTVEGKDVVINATQQFAITSSFAESLIEIVGLEINDCKSTAVNVGGSTTILTDVTIHKPVVNGVSVNDGGRLTLTNAKITEPGLFGAEIKSSTLTMTGVTITSPVGAGIQNQGGTVTGTNTTINSAGTYGIWSEKAGAKEGIVEISDLTVNGTGNHGLYSKSSVIRATGGTIQNAGANSTGKVAVFAEYGGKVYLSGTEEEALTITGTKYWSVLAQQGADSYVNLNNVTITGGERGIVAYNQAKIEGTNVEINDTSNFSVTSSHAGTEVKIIGLKINNCKFGAAAVNVGTSTNIFEDVEIVNPAGNGFNVNDKGILTLTNAAITNPVIGINNIGSTVTGTGVTITDSKNYAVYSKNGQDNVTNLEVKNSKKHGVNVDGSMTILKDVLIDTTEWQGIGIYGGGTLDLTNARIINTNYGTVKKENGTYILDGVKQ